MSYGRKLLANIDFTWGVLLALGSGFLLILAYQPQEATIFASGDSMVWPRYVLWPLFALSIVLVVKSLWGAGELYWKPEDVAKLRRPFLLGMVTLGGFALVSVIGFLPFTLIFSAIAALVMGRQRPIAVAIVSISVTLVVWLAFGKALSLPLPRGIGLFRDISAVLY